MKYLRIFWDFFKLSPGSTLRHKTLVFACLLTCLVSMVGLSINVVLKMPLLVIALNLAMVGVYLILYLQSRRNYSSMLALLYAYLSLLLLTLVWFPNAGLLGSTPIFYIALLTLCFFVLSGKQALLFLASVMVSLSCLYFIEWYYPVAPVPYSSVQQQKLDLFLSLLTVSLIVGVCLFIFRTAQESEEHLVQNALEYKTRFLSHMSHELRTPLNAVLGFSQVLQKNAGGNLSEKELDYLQRIFNSGQHMLGLVNDLLDLERLESQKLAIDRQPVELIPLVLQVFKSFEIQAQTQNQYLTYDPPESPLPTIYTDPQRLRQILINLLGNAIKYTPEEEHIILRVRRGFEMIWIDVIDSGPGIEPEVQELIFKPFYQLNPTSTGAGLGLAITAQLCQTLAFSLKLKSQKGQGCQFTVGIPL